MKAYLAYREPNPFLFTFHYSSSEEEKENVPLECVDNSYTKSGNEANTKRTNNTANSDAQAATVDRRKHLAGDNASDDPPAYLHDYIEDTGKLCRPVAHEISTKYLSSKQYRLAIYVNRALEPCKIHERRQRSVRALTSLRYVFCAHTYHRSISTLWPKCGYIRGSTRGKSIGKDDNADAIHPAKLKDQWTQQTSDDI